METPPDPRGVDYVEFAFTLGDTVFRLELTVGVRV
jgi:hypothetical protein